jgi:hypothetical protein
MAKKVVATLKTGTAVQYAKVIRAVKSEKTGAYAFKEDLMLNDLVKDFIAKNK